MSFCASLKSAYCSRRRDRRGSSTKSLQAKFMQGVIAMTKFQKKAFERNAKKKSMLSRLSKQQAQLFTLLSARDWHDYRPKINPSTEGLLEDRDPEKAWNLVQDWTKHWSGQVSKGGLINFLSSGFEAHDVDEQPGGYTLFMFSPLADATPRSKKDRELAIRSVFGEGKVDDETVKYYLKNNLFLAKSLEQAERQIKTGVKFLEKITHKDSIGTRGYSYGLKLVEQHRRLFDKALKRDRMFMVKFSYLLDRVFQNFVNRLGSFYQTKDPIRAARSHLRESMEEEIDDAMRGFTAGAYPNLSLPVIIMSPESNEEDASDGERRSLKKRKAPDADTTPADAPDWHTKNPSPGPAWGLPAGKSFSAFFNTRDEALRANFTDFPKFKHHRQSVVGPKPLCAKYQAAGRCRGGCPYAHVPPNNISPSKKDEVAARFKQIYS